MELSLADAAALLGKSPRQVRYLIRQGKLKARKVANRWVIDRESLPLSAGQKRAASRKAEALAAAVDDALRPAIHGGRRRYSVRDLAAFGLLRPQVLAARALLGDDHRVTAALEGALVALTRGCHRYHDGDKAQAYREAREAVSTAVAHLYLMDERGAAIATSLEDDVMPALAGLNRRVERSARP